METRIVAVPTAGQPGRFREAKGLERLQEWHIDTNKTDAVAPLERAAEYLRTKDTPVAFPTETVYGLGADATRSASVKGIYAAKGRPSDNPLIVHVCDLHMLRSLLARQDGDETNNGTPIPNIYEPLIERFWPGPLTILLPNPRPSRLAPEVTAGLESFGVRMPSSPLALSLIKLAGVPLAAPSANASTKPSPTTAQHVRDDLDGRIELILDGGPCDVGVESTVVDGLCTPPVVLRPGGVGMDQLRSCPGWEHAVKGYKDQSEVGNAAPRAPGMKYKHYSPKARVVLYESACRAGSDGVALEDKETPYPTQQGHTTSSAAVNGSGRGSGKRRVGVVRTKRWKPAAGLKCVRLEKMATRMANGHNGDMDSQLSSTSYDMCRGDIVDAQGRATGEVIDVNLGTDTRRIAQGLFSALRELDQLGAETIFVDGIEDELDIAAAVMNRLRKAASEIRS